MRSGSVLDSGSGKLRAASGFLLLVLLSPTAAQAPPDNGIHVGEPKIYDSRALTLMLDDLAQSLRKTSFIDPKALASALGNLQGFRNDDFSQALSANGAVGPGAAAVFAAAGGAPPAPAAGATPPGVSITVAPVLNAGSAPAAAPVAAAPQLGPAPPTLPTLQTAPAFTPNFGPSSADLLSDEVNLTYQFDNIRMLLDRSLTDRLYDHQARLQAVIGFDVDIEPPAEAKDAAAIVEVTVTMANCNKLQDCDGNKRLSLVAMMPEEGSHNAATLSQKASAFGGAVASAVFSVGYAAQKRSQVFYLYRDMDTLSFQKPADAVNTVDFGWQFRPVLGRRSVAAGMRHMMAVLALPANDLPEPRDKTEPELSVHIHTTWTHYDGQTQTTSVKPGFWAQVFGSDDLPKAEVREFSAVSVPTTAISQDDLSPKISEVKWVRSDASSGVAIVSGRNFFPETMVRFGSKTYSTPAEGLTIKSDQQLEVALPLSSAVGGGVLSGRYGKALSLEYLDPSLPARFNITRLSFFPTGNDMYEVRAILEFQDKDHKGVHFDISDLQNKANAPVVSANGIPLLAPSYMSQPESKDPNPPIELTTFLPSALVKAGPVTITVTFPFAGSGWSASLPHYDATLKVDRLGGKTDTRLLISGTDKTLLLCGPRPEAPPAKPPAPTWVLELDGKKTFSLLTDSDKTPPTGGLRCIDRSAQVLGLDIPTADLKQYHHFAMVNLAGNFPPLVGEIPAPDPPPPGPSLDKDQKISVVQNDVKAVTFKGKNLDQVKQVLFDKMKLGFTPGKDGKTIAIYLSRAVTAKPRTNAELQLISDDNDPVEAPLTVTPAPASKGDK